MPPKRNTIFISYSHDDKALLDELMTMLQPLVRREMIRPWSDSQILGGAKWRDEINNAIDTACIALLLVSASFFDSPFIMDTELPRIFEAAVAGTLQVQWIALNYSLYQLTEISEYQALNDPGKPLASLHGDERQKALVDIARKIQKAVAQIQASEPPS